MNDRNISQTAGFQTWTRSCSFHLDHNPGAHAIRFGALVSFWAPIRHRVLAVGDRKSPVCEWPAGSEFVSLERQNGMDLDLVVCYRSTTTAGRILAISKRLRAVPRFSLIPTMTTLRCRTGDLVACTRSQTGSAQRLGECLSMVFVSTSFGLAVSRSNICRNVKKRRRMRGSAGIVECPVQQGLVNGSPDVDAVWRLIFDRGVQFRQGTKCLVGTRSVVPLQQSKHLVVPKSISFIVFTQLRQLPCYGHLAQLRCPEVPLGTWVRRRVSRTGKPSTAKLCIICSVISRKKSQLTSTTIASFRSLKRFNCQEEPKQSHTICTVVMKRWLLPALYPNKKFRWWRRGLKTSRFARQESMSSNNAA